MDAPRKAKELTEWTDRRNVALQGPPMEAPFVRSNDLTAVLSRCPSLLLDPVLAHGTNFIHTRVLGPETG